MASLLGPLGEQLTVQRYNERRHIFEGFGGRTVTVYLDEGRTQLATIYAYDSGTPTVPGAAISGSKVDLDDEGKLPLFWFPDDVTRVYAAVTRGPVVPLDARTPPPLAGEFPPSFYHLISWTESPSQLAGATGTNTMTSAKMYLTRVPVPSDAGPITNIELQVMAVGVGLTSAYVALYRTDKTLVAQSADVSATFMGSAGNKTIPLLDGPFTDLAGQDVYVAVWSTGTTTPSFARGQSQTNSLMNYKLTLDESRFVQGPDAVEETAPDPVTFLSQWATSLWAALS